jgi:hypothetical protein
MNAQPAGRTRPPAQNFLDLDSNKDCSACPRSLHGRRGENPLGHRGTDADPEPRIFRDQLRADYFPDPLSCEHNLRVAKPWRCRLRLHDWEARTNSETGEHYEVCRQCRAYRDRGTAAPGRFPMG